MFENGEPQIKEQAGKSPRWWPLSAAMGLLLVALWSFLTARVGIAGSHPAYRIMLVVVVLGALALGGWALLASPAQSRSVFGTWIARGGLLLAATLTIGSVVYLRPLSASQVAIDSLRNSNGIAIHESSTTIRMDPASGAQRTGLAFYPGAKVDPRAYVRLLRPAAEAGYPVVIFKQPFNLAILDSNAADSVVGVTGDDVDRWVIAGHSLGGAMAARYAERDRRELAGLLFYAAYPVVDMSKRTSLQVMSISGTKDGLATAADIDESVANLPTDAVFVRIKGAIHAYFGDYGSQRGDGSPTISRKKAQAVIAAETIKLLNAIDTAPA